MIKSELIMRLAKEAKLSKADAQKVVETIFGEMTKTLLAGGRIELRNFGVFYLRQHKARIGRNPKTGEKVMVAEKKVPCFKAGKSVKKALNKHSS